MTVKMSDIVAKVQKAVDELNRYTGKLILDEPLINHYHHNTFRIYLRNHSDYYLTINRTEIIGNTDQALVGLVSLRLVRNLTEIKRKLNGNLRSLGCKGV